MAKLILIVSIIFLSNFTVQGSKAIFISTATDDETTASNITSTNGEIYDCVDFYQQPAFKQRPLLKYLSISKEVYMKLFTKFLAEKAKEGIGGCPIGTVPILRSNNDQHIHSPQNVHEEQDHCYAVVRTNTPNSKILGAGGDVTIYNPSIASNQWSAARMRLTNGPDSIEVGWMVNRDLFNDTKTHLYARFLARGKSCYNLQCPGFIQVAKDVPLGYAPNFISERPKSQYFWTLSISKNQSDGNWWVTIGKEKYGIGYWPKMLFTSLKDFATMVEWGGEVYNPASSGEKAPEMGCGYKPVYDTRLSDFYSNTTIIDENLRVSPPPQGTTKFQNCRRLYRVIDDGYVGPHFGRTIYFGGPFD